MAPLDPRAADLVLVEQLVSALRGLVVAVHCGDKLKVAGGLSLLVNAIVAHSPSLVEREGDEPLRRAIARLRVSA